MTPLHYAAKYGHSEICKLLIENAKEKNPANKKGQTPLCLAIQNGNREIYEPILLNRLENNSLEDTPDDNERKQHD